jgi:hypothetical protein
MSNEVQQLRSVGAGQLIIICRLRISQCCNQTGQGLREQMNETIVDVFDLA